MSLFDRVVMVGFAFAFGVTIAMAFIFNDKDNECKEKGGKLIDTANGYVCAKMEIIK